MEDFELPDEVDYSKEQFRPTSIYNRGYVELINDGPPGNYRLVDIYSEEVLGYISERRERVRIETGAWTIQARNDEYATNTIEILNIPYDSTE